MKKFHTFLFFLVFIYSLNLFAQDSTQSSSWSFSGYVDAYGAYYTDSVGVNNYQQFPTVSPRSKEMGLNIAMLTAKYSTDRIRGIITLQYGDIPKTVWSATYNYIQQANVGVRLAKNLWLDGGFFLSHIGSESFLPKDNISSAVAIPTFFEPNYEAGFKLSYSPTEKFAVSLFALNGYNLYEDNNFKKSAGLLATYAFNDKLNIGYDNYLGDDSSEGDSVSHFRFYNNIFVNYSVNKFRIVTGVDFGVQENSDLKNINKSASVTSGIFAIAYQAAKKFDIYGQGEFYNDPNGILSGVFVNDNNDTTGLKIWGITLGVEYKPTENSYVRIEGRNLKAADSQKIFRWDNEKKNSRFEAMLNLGITFQ